MLDQTPLDTHISLMSKKYDVPEDVIRAVIRRESAGNPKAVSPVGAQGLMQLMPGTAQEMGVTDPFDPYQNVEGGVKYLKKMSEMFNGDLSLTLAAYNAGPKRVMDFISNGRSLPNETQEYVRAIQDRLGDIDVKMPWNQPPSSAQTSPNSSGVIKPPAQQGVMYEKNGIVNMVSPEGEMVGIETKDFSTAQKSGLRLPTQQELNKYHHIKSLQTPGQQLLTGIESAASMATFGVSPGIERALGVNPEDIRLREELNPVSSGIGSVAGLFAPGGAAKGIGKAGQFAAGLAGKVGAGAVLKGAASLGVESALFSVADEIHDKMLGDPNQTAQTAVQHVLTGLALGAGLGVGVGAVKGVAGKIGEAISPSTRISQDLKEAEKHLDLFKDKAPTLSPEQAQASFERGVSAAQTDIQYEHLKKLLEGGTKFSSAALGLGKTAAGMAVGDLLGSAVGMPFMGELLGAYSQRKAAINALKNLFETPAHRYLLSDILKGDTENVTKMFNFLIEHNEAVDKSIISGIKNIYGVTLASLPTVPYTTSKVAEQIITPDNFSSVRNSINSISSDPTSAGKLIDQAPLNLQHLKMLPNRVRDSASDGMLRGLRHLDSVLPKDKPAAPFKQSYAPSKGELAKANRVASVLINPVSVIDRLVDGTYTDDHGKTLEIAYPLIAQRLKQELAEAMVHPDAGVSKDTQRLVESFIGTADVSTHFVEKQQEQAAPKPQIRPLNTKVAERVTPGGKRSV